MVDRISKRGAPFTATHLEFSKYIGHAELSIFARVQH